jgi:primosomal protein N' (replication factor Y)
VSRTRPAGVGARSPAAVLPVARVAVDVPLPHLDRTFDYLVPAEWSESAAHGCRVRVRFAGRLVDGFVLERVADTEHAGRLSYLTRLVSPEPVLTSAVAALARAVADRYAGTLADVLRLAIPPRHATVEVEPTPAQPPPDSPAPHSDAGWAEVTDGPGFLAAVRAGGAPRAVWRAPPGTDWASDLATAARAALDGGRGALLVVPDMRDAAQVSRALDQVAGPGRHVLLTSDLGPAERYRRWLAVRRGAVRAVVGTRAAAFAPVADLGLVAIWDDGDDLHAEPRAPYPHVREVLLLRSEQERTAVLVGGVAQTAEATLLLRTGWARVLSAPRATLRLRAPRIRPAGEDAELARDPAARSARLPTLAWTVAHDTLRAGAPVLVQVPRAGYRPGLGCAGCRRPARCVRCHGPLHGRPDSASVDCSWCGHTDAGWRCPHCGSGQLRAVVVGAERTAEELGRAFPGFAVLLSGGGRVTDRVADTPTLVVATPGAEPVADRGYGAALLLDGWLLLSRPDLRAAEETLRRWSNAAALVRGAAQDGTVVVVADGALPVTQALLRWDHGWFADRELDERAALRFPPGVRLAELTGPAAEVAALLADASLPAGADVLGPVRIDADTVRTLVRVRRRDGGALAAALHARQAARSARKLPPIRVRIDPADLG